MGSEMINAIKSGFGLIVDLSEMFVSGFETLVWVPATEVGGVAVAGHLTSVAEYSLIFLGIAGCYACIKLVFNFLRGNTGA